MNIFIHFYHLYFGKHDSILIFVILGKFFIQVPLLNNVILLNSKSVISHFFNSSFLLKFFKY